MSDSEDSTVTYTEVSSPFKDLSDIRSLGVIVHGYYGLAMMLEDPYFVPEPAYPEFMPPEDDVLPAEEQPLPTAVLPTADSPGYISESDLEEDSKEDNKDPEEDLADYPTDRDEEEEEMFIRDQTPIPFPSEAEIDRLLSISTPPSSPLTSYSSPLPQIPSPPPPISSPVPMSSPPLPASPTHPLGYRAAMIQLRDESPSTSYPLPLPLPIILPHTRASMAIMRDVALSTYILSPRSGILPSETPPSGTPPLLPIPLPTSSPPLLLPSTNYRVDVLEVTLPPRKRLCIALGTRYEVEESSSAPTTRPTRGFRADYGFVGTLDVKIRQLGQKMTNFVTAVRPDTDEIYGRLDDTQDDRSLMSGQLNLLRRDRCAHARTSRLMESEARTSREAWHNRLRLDWRFAGYRPQTIGTAHKGTDSVEDIIDSDGSTIDLLSIIFSCDLKKMAPKRTTRSTPATTTILITSVTDEQLKRLIAQGVANVLAEREAPRSRNGEGSHNSGMGGRRQVLRFLI
ncbi:hypothetical protein Tco_0077772 [Tanacetum coccineum]